MLTSILTFGQNNVCFEVEKNPFSSVSGFDVFTKFVNVYGVHVFATNDVDNVSVLHCTSILAEYLDNDEDGTIDNTEVLNEMLIRNASMVLFPYDGHEDQEYFFNNADPSYDVQDLYGDEIFSSGSSEENGFDATLEEVLHLITHAGYAHAYPTVFGEELGTEVALAMNEARGGYFPFVPDEYPTESWYHYYDETCDYFCQITEYFYWSLTSNLGAQNYSGRCEEIEDEWELCEPIDFISEDILMSNLLLDPEYNLPTSLPDGNYCPVIDISEENKEEFIMFFDSSDMTLHISNICGQSLQIYNLLGKLVYQKSGCQCVEELSLNISSSGMFILVINEGISKKFFIDLQ